MFYQAFKPLFPYEWRAYMAKGNAFLSEALNEAEREARRRENPLNLVLSEEEQLRIAEAQALLDNYGAGLYFKKPTSNVRFVQIVQENLDFLFEKEYLTGEESMFLFRILPKVCLGTNCLVENVKAKNPVPLNQKGLADLLGKKTPYVSRIVKQLVQKGILFKGSSGGKKVSAKSYALYVNPAIAISGTKTNIPAHLREMFFYINLELDCLKDLPVKAF